MSRGILVLSKQVFCSPSRRGGFSPHGSGRMRKLVKQATSPIRQSNSNSIATPYDGIKFRYELNILQIHDVNPHIWHFQTFLRNFLSQNDICALSLVISPCYMLQVKVNRTAVILSIKITNLPTYPLQR